MQRYSSLTSKDGFKIEFYADEDVSIYADPTRMLQVVYNLINNAINYSGEDKHIRVYQTVNDGKVKISIKDNGEGIAEENLSKIWDRYYKVDSVHKRAVAGTGLGLYIVKEILEDHDAIYGVESDIGKGSTFWFELETM
jgi:signal transduction histidine kinase